MVPDADIVEDGGDNDQVGPDRNPLDLVLLTAPDDDDVVEVVVVLTTRSGLVSVTRSGPNASAFTSLVVSDSRHVFE